MQESLLEIEPAQPFSIRAEMSSGPEEVWIFMVQMAAMTSDASQWKKDKPESAPLDGGPSSMVERRSDPREKHETK